MSRATNWTAALAAVGALAAPAAGQQATRVIGATQPSKGEFDATWLVSVDTYDDDPTGADREVTDLSIRSMLRYGISRDWSATLEVPLVTRETEKPSGDDTITGMGDIRADLRYRFYQHDFGPLNTIRLAVRGGVEAPTGTEDIGSHSWDPTVGFSAMYIRGKWGLNGAVDYKLSTSDVNDNAIMGAGEDDLLELGAAAVYRLMPEEWGTEAHGAGYVMLESVARFETGGDRELVLYPGLLWEDTRWAAELSVGVPVWQESNDRLEREVSFTVGFRWLF